jgi:hypothetical protein
MLTVVETPLFLKQAEKLFSEQERVELIDFLSAFPMAGDEIVGSGGLRKVRYAIGGKGKSGGARVIYFFYNEDAPLYLVTCYGKSEKRDLSRAEINAFAKLTAAIKAHHRKDWR